MGKHLVVASLVFGGTKSGCGFSMISDPLNIIMVKMWNGVGVGVGCMPETSTCLLLDKEKQFVAFGYDAKDRYVELVMDEEHANYYFFDRFTMSLHNNENVTRDMVLKDKTGKQCSVVEVFTLSIKAVVDRFMKKLETICKGCLGDDILWVLIVPSAWIDSAKQLMRESAEKAGLHSENVLLITETEAAFTYCDIYTTWLQRSKPGSIIKEPGTKSMVVDLGGVTADITVVQQTYNGKLKELFRVSGDHCAGTSVDDRFCSMLEEMVGGDTIAELKRQDLYDWIDLLRAFKRNKKTFTTSAMHATLINLPLSLMEIYKELHGKNLKAVIDSSSYAIEITRSSQKMSLKADLMMKFFTPTIDSIITLIKNTLSNRSTNGLSIILMVGGFSECSLIQEAVKKAFPDKQIIIPGDAGLSVLKGAVLFGHQPVKGDSLDDDDDDDDDGCIGK